METSATPRRAYRRYGSALWTRIEEDFRKGETAPFLSARYGPSPGTIYNRSRREGWSKKAQAEAAPVPEGEQTPIPRAETVREAAQLAGRQAAEEMSAGRPRAASEFAKLAELLSRVADRLEPAVIEGEPDVFEILRARLDEADAGGGV